jgi:hypothetical protein
MQHNKKRTWVRASSQKGDPMDAMEKTGLNFGLVIAYLIPGFLATYAVASRVSTVDALLGGPKRVPDAASVVPLVLIAVGVGIIINAISAVVIRNLIHLSGVKEEEEFVTRKLRDEDIRRYDHMVEATFRYHQFYSNMLIAVVLLAPIWLLWPLQDNILRNASFLVVVVVLSSTARDSLQQFYKGLRKLCEKDNESQSS